MIELASLYILEYEDRAQLVDGTWRIVKIVWIAIAAIVFSALLFYSLYESNLRLLESQVVDPSNQSIVPFFWLMVA